MLKLQISSPIWLLCTFLSIGCCLTSFQQAQAVAFTDPNEVIALKSLAQKWSTDLKTSNSNTWKTPWNLFGDPCTGRATDETEITDTSMNPAFKCDCSFNNGNTCHVTQMKAYAIDITGQIPAELANLTYLFDLNLGQNYLTGPIPAFLGDLTAMQYLSLGINNLSGPVPKELGNLHDLIVLSFSSNNLNGTLPPELGNLRALEQMNLAQNYLTGPIPAFLGDLTRMQYLALGINNLSGPVPKELGNLQSLISLSFSSNNLNGTLPPELGNLRALEQMYIDSAGVSGEIPSTFRNLQNLKILWASDNQFTGGIPDFIGSWKNLNELKLQGNAFKGPIPSSLSNLTSLTNLRVSDITSGLSSLSFLKNLKKLTTLVLRNNMISGELPSYIGEFIELELLDLSFNNFTGGIPDSLRSLSKLKFLLLGNNSLSGKLPSQKSASLAYIDLSYNQFSGALPTWLNNLQVNLVGNYFATNETDNRFSGRQLGCLQRTFPCNEGAPRYSRFAINCGGGQTIFAMGDVFDPENETLNGTSFYVSSTQKWGVSYTGQFMDSSTPTYIATNESQFTKTLHSELYQTARLSPSSLRYHGLGLENGPYTVKLHFAEIQIENTNSWKSVGRRIFDVYVQGQKVLTDFDIRKEAGGSNIGVVKSFNKTNVKANFLEIHLFWAGKGTCCIPFQGTYGPLVSAISVTPEFNPTKKSKTGIAIGIIIGITVGIVAALICIILVFILRRRRVQKLAATDVEEEKAINDIRSKLKIFSYADMKTATGDFARENKLGEGGYGAVFKGTLSDGEIVAVKKLSSESRQGKREFINEVAAISAVQHKNLVKLHGCCLEADDRLLVYEYLENKSLDKALLGNKKSHIRLDWPTRYNICIGAACGLTYLHEEASTRIIHRDIKASNILLDDSLNPKIADFGLARLYDEEKTHISTRVAGTIGYLSPEYAMRGHLTEKADVFSFGVVALELVSGRSNTDTSLPENMIYLLEWTWHLYEKGRPLELMDPDLESTCSKEEVLRVVEVALLCTQAMPTMRPSMSRVVAMLTGDVKVIPAASRPGYIKDLQYNNVIAGATSTGSTSVIATTPMHNSKESSAERECHSIED